MTGCDVRFEGVSRRFGDRVVLEDQTVAFAPGQVTVIRGSSGVGKSTVLNLLAGYLDPDRGRVVRDGSLGYLMQEELLYSELTALDNMALRIGGTLGAQRVTSSLIADCLDQIGIAHLGPLKAAQLSGGERRRVEVAAVLATAPDVVLLDEPATGLDPANRDIVYEAIWKAFQATTVVLVTHESEIPGLPVSARSLQLEGGGLS